MSFTEIILDLQRRYPDSRLTIKAVSYCGSLMFEVLMLAPGGVRGHKTFVYHQADLKKLSANDPLLLNLQQTIPPS